MDGTGITAGPAGERAAELTAMLCDPSIRCVLPPWGGETAIDLVDLLDWDALAAAEPTWLVGSPTSPPSCCRSPRAWAGPPVHGDNLADTPYAVPDGLLSWLDIVVRPGPASAARLGPGRRLVALRGGPAGDRVEAGRRRAVDSARCGLPARHRPSDRRCVETLSNLAGTPYGDVSAFGRQHAEDGLIVYLEAAEDEAATICRNLHGLRLAGWFEHARAVLIGRTNAPDHPKLTQREAVLDALGRLGLPIVFDLEIGHVPPHLPLVNGALATLTVEGDTREIVQRLC